MRISSREEEGNGRLGRLLATLMALQASLPVLDFSELDGVRREDTNLPYAIADIYLFHGSFQ